jgi:hypothetical protein
MHKQIFSSLEILLDYAVHKKLEMLKERRERASIGKLKERQKRARIGRIIPSELYYKRYGSKSKSKDKVKK